MGIRSIRELSVDVPSSAGVNVEASNAMIEDEISLAETPRDMFSIVGQEPGGSAR